MKYLTSTSAFLLFFAGFSGLNHAVSPMTVDLQGADGFSILAGSGITNTGPSSVNGYVGTYPTASQTGMGSMNQGCTNYGNGPFTQAAQNDATTAYNDAMGRPATTVGTELGGTTLFTGVYKSAAGDLAVGLNLTLTLDANGDTSAVFIFQAASTLTTGSNSVVNLINGAKSENVFWVIGSSATLGSNTAFKGTIIAFSSITSVTGSSNGGRLIARNGAVTVDSIAINTTAKVPCNPSTPTHTPTASPSVTITPTITRTPTFSIFAVGTISLSPEPPASGGDYIYPSPSTGKHARVAYDLREAGDVTLRFYNQTGRLVATVTDSRATGWHNSGIDVDKFAAGNYLYVMSVHYQSGTREVRPPRKFVVLH